MGLARRALLARLRHDVAPMKLGPWWDWRQPILPRGRVIARRGAFVVATGVRRSAVRWSVLT